MARTSSIDVLLCHCGGLRKLIAFIPDPRIAQEALHRLGLSSAPPLLSPLPKEHCGVDSPFHEEVYRAS